MRDSERRILARRPRPRSFLTPRSAGSVPVKTDVRARPEQIEDAVYGITLTFVESMTLMIPFRKTKSKLVIRAGTGDDRKVFEVESYILSESSGFFRSYIQESRFSLNKDLDFSKEDSTAVAMFIDWAKRPTKPITYTLSQYSMEPWMSHAADAWLFGKRFNAPEFQRYALSQFIQNSAVMIHGPWKLIEQRASAQTPLRRFSDHWIAWNCLLLGIGPHEYSGLEAAKFARHATMSTHDPRTFDPEHWYTHCGNDIDATCTHDPLVRQKQQEKAQSRCRPPPAEWGREWEEQFNSHR
ncbi:MAG: hypothetical protein M1822_002430 [Bathelium mastoideum]|nr:MAG: hypothetical protein M1822_002430 [Bathelium mastoideum]